MFLVSAAAYPSSRLWSPATAAGTTFSSGRATTRPVPASASPAWRSTACYREAAGADTIATRFSLSIEAVPRLGPLRLQQCVHIGNPSQSRSFPPLFLTTADPHEVTFVVDDLHVREPAEYHDAAVVGAEARKGMAAASHGQQEPCVGSESDTCLHVPDALGPQNIGRTTRRQYRATSRFVLRSARFDDVAAEVTAEDFKR
jgi:hypothetical protein